MTTQDDLAPMPESNIPTHVTGVSEMRYVLRLPRLPSPLLKSSTRVHWTRIAAAKREDTDYAMMRARQERLPPSMPWSAVDMKVTMYFATQRERDKDNFHAMLKGFIDGLVKAHLITNDDDSVIRSFTLTLVVDIHQAPATGFVLTPLPQVREMLQ